MPDGFKIASAWVSVSPDLEGFEEDAKARLDAASAGLEATARLRANSDQLDGDLSDAVEKLAGFDGLEAEARLLANDDELREKADLASARLDELDGKTARPRIDLEDGDFRRKLAEDEADASSFGDSSYHPLIAAAVGGITASLPGIAGAATGLGALGAAGALAFGGIGSAVEQAGQATQSASQTSAQLASTEFSNTVATQQAQQSLSQARQQAAEDAVTSSQQVASAQAQLAVTQRDSAAQQVQALESVASADHEVGVAQYTLTEAQYGYSQAVVQARDNIVALNDALADQKLSVDAAALAVHQAQQQQVLTDQNAYSTALQREQAALAVRQAQQQLKDATDQLTVSQQNANQANQQGVSGSQQVIQAKNAVTQAQYGVSSAQQAYADAQQALTRTELDNAAQVKASQQAVTQAQQQQAYQQRADAQAVSSAQQQLTDTIREQQLQMAATGGAAQTFASDMSRLSPEAQQAAYMIIGLKGDLKALEDTAQAAVLPGFMTFLEGAQSLLPEVQAGIAAVGQGIGNSFAQAGQEMETSGVRKVLDGLIENGITFDQVVLPAIAQFGGALANAGAQKGAVDGLANGIAGIAGGLTGVVKGVQPFESGVSEVLSTVGTVADAAGKPLGTLVGVLATGLSPALQALDPVVLQVGGDLVTVFTAAKPALTEAGQVIGDMAPVVSELAGALTGGLAGGFEVVDAALRPVDAFLGTRFGPDIAAGVIAIGAFKSAAEAIGATELWQGIQNGVSAFKGLAIAEGEAEAAGSFGWIASAVQGVKDFAAATEGATGAERALFAAETAADAINPLGWVALGVGVVTGLALAFDHADNSTQAYVTTLKQADDATGYNIAGYQKLAGQLGVAAEKQQNIADTTRNYSGELHDSQSATYGQATAANALTQAQQQAESQARNLTGALGGLERQYGLTQGQAEQLASAAGVQASALSGGGNAAKAAMDAIEKYANANTSAQGPIGKTSSDFATLANNTLTASDRTGAMDDAYQQLVGNFVSSQQTQLQVQQDFLTLASNASQSGASMDGTNQASNQLTQSFYTAISDIRQHADAMVQDGSSAKDVTGYLQGVIGKLAPYTKGNKDASTAVKDLTGYMNGLIDSLKKMPKKEQADIGVTATGKWTVQQVQSSENLHLTRSAATGGLIEGPGGPTDDVIPVLASNREYVVQAAAVDHYGVGLFEALNAQHLAAGGSVDASYSGSVQGLPAWDTKELSATASAVAGALAATAPQLAGAGGYSAIPGGVSGSVASWFAAGVKAAKVPTSWIPGLEEIAHYEVNNPNAVNDSPAGIAAGTPRGIMQEVPGTFLAYHVPGTSYNIFDPVANIASASRYIEADYGNPLNTPGLIAVSRGEAYSGYDSGGWLPPGQLNFTGKPEAVLTPDESTAFVALVRQLVASGSTATAAARPPVQVIFNGPQMPGHEQMAEIERRLALLIGGLWTSRRL